MKKPTSAFCSAVCCVLSLLILSCSTQSARAKWEREGDRLEEATRHKKVASTFEGFISSPSYRNSRDMWRGAALEQYNPKKSYVEILLGVQRGRLYINGMIAMDFPICSGRVGGHETPKGSFRISEKIRDYRSNLYGSFVNSAGKVVKYNVSASDARPAGTTFRGAEMPYWMRFNGAVGMHVGSVHREGQSHGCVRVPVEACEILFNKLAVGSRVIVK